MSLLKTTHTSPKSRYSSIPTAQKNARAVSINASSPPPDSGASGGVQTAPRALYRPPNDGKPAGTGISGTWTPGSALHARLEALWDEGLSAAAIGARLGYSKNAIVGAVHRLGLPGRPSPIKVGGREAGAKLRAKQLAAAGRITLPGRQHVPLPAGAASLPPLASAAVPTPHVPTRSRAPRVLPPKQPERAPAARCPLPAARYPLPAAPVSGHACLWPQGEPGTRDFRFCGVPRSRIDRPYCEEHCAVAYVGLGKWRSDTARALERAT